MDEEKSISRGIKHFPMYDSNPFGETTIIEKRDSMVGLGKKDVVINGETGEVIGQQRLVISKKIDSEQFVKVFTNRIRDILKLQPPSMKTLFYLISKAEKDSDMIDFDVDECMEFCGYKSSRSIFTALVDLLQNKLIARANNSKQYFINPGIVFNGNRLTVVEDYHKVSKKELEEDQEEKNSERKKLEEDVRTSRLNFDESGEEELPFG